MKIGRWLWGISLVLAQSAAAQAADVDHYALPRTKVYMAPCRAEARLSHPGTIVEQRLIHRGEAFWVRYHIHAEDESEWLVLCDGLTGKIVREQRLENWPW